MNENDGFPWSARGGDGAGETPPAEAVRYRRRHQGEDPFPGCRTVRLRRDALEDFEGRLEYWEARTETARVAEPTGGAHEAPTRLLPLLVGRMAEVRGSSICHLGSVDLLERDAAGAPVRMMQADETVFLHPSRWSRPSGSLVVGQDALPDVTLEVDYTTDARPGKLQAQGRTEERARMVREVVRARGIPVPDTFPGPADAGVPSEQVMAAAMACTDEADFRRRLR